MVKWASHYRWDTIKDELTKLSQKQSSRDDILKLIPEPLRLEFLSSLAIVTKFPDILVKPNYVTDDEGLPTSYAPGGKPDIECEEMEKYILVEVTMLVGTQQYMKEIPSIARHLEERLNSGQDAISLFVAPMIFIDSSRFVKFLEKDEGLKIYAFSIKEFILNLETKDRLYIKNR